MALQQFCAGVGAARVKDLEEIFGLPGAFNPQASTSALPAFDWAAPATRDAIAPTLEASSLQGSLLPSQLEAAWIERHQTICERDCQPLQLGGEKPSRCRFAGMCVCRGAGSHVHKLRNALHREMKSAFPHSTPGRDLLLNGFLVMHLVGGQIESEPAALELFLHVGFLLGRPFRPTYRQMRRSSALAEQHADEHIYLEAELGMGSTMEDFTATKLLDTTLPWSVSWLELVSNELPASRLAPHTLPAKVHRPAGRADDAKPIWPLGKGRPRGSRNVPRSTGPAGIEGENEGGEEEEEAEEEMPLDAGDAEAPDDPIQDLLDTFWTQLRAESELMNEAGETQPQQPQEPESAPAGDDQRADQSLSEALPDDRQGAASSSQALGRVIQGHDGKLAVDGGTISFYPSKNVFEARCNNPLHGSCVLTRSGWGLGATTRRRAKGFGRPLGLLSSWLSAGVACGSKAEHWQEEHTKPHHHIRQMSRLVLESLPGAGELLAHERPREGDEDEEPRMPWDAPGQAD